MKLIKLTGLYGAAFIALLLSVTSCKKSSNSSSQAGTLTFQVNGKTASFTAVADSFTMSGTDTLYGIYLTAEGTLPGTTDSVSIDIQLNNEVGYVAQYNGSFPSNGQSAFSGCQYYDAASGNSYGNLYNGPSFFYADITSNNGSVVRGTFSGTLYNVTGIVKPTSDSLVIANGQFSAQLR